MRLGRKHCSQFRLDFSVLFFFFARICQDHYCGFGKIGALDATAQKLLAQIEVGWSHLINRVTNVIFRSSSMCICKLKVVVYASR